MMIIILMKLQYLQKQEKDGIYFEIINSKYYNCSIYIPHIIFKTTQTTYNYQILHIPEHKTDQRPHKNHLYVIYSGSKTPQRWTQVCFTSMK